MEVVYIFIGSADSERCLGEANVSADSTKMWLITNYPN